MTAIDSFVRCTICLQYYLVRHVCLSLSLFYPWGSLHSLWYPTVSNGHSGCPVYRTSTKTLCFLTEGQTQSGWGLFITNGDELIVPWVCFTTTNIAVIIRDVVFSQDRIRYELRYFQSFADTLPTILQSSRGAINCWKSWRGLSFFSGKTAWTNASALFDWENKDHIQHKVTSCHDNKLRDLWKGFRVLKMSLSSFYCGNRL